MSSKGAIKKRTDAESVSKSHTSHKVKSRITNELEDKLDRKDKRREPQIIDARASGDKRLNKTSKQSLVSKNVLPDKNPVKLKQVRQNNVPSTSKTNTEQSSRYSSTVKKTEPSRTKSESSRVRSDNAVKTSRSESNVKSNVTDKTRNNVRKSTKEKVQAHYNEKRGVSTIYMPKDAASKLKSSLSQSSNTRRSREKPSATVSSEKSLPKDRRSSRERRRSRTLSPSEVKVLHAGTKINSKGLKKKHEESENEIEDEIDEDCNYQDDSEDYESDLEDYISESPISEESEHETSSLELEPIELHTEKKKTTIDSAEVSRKPEEEMLDSGHYELLAEAKKRAAMVESLMANRLSTPPSSAGRKDTVNQSYREERQAETKSLPSSTDEGFEDSRSGDFAKTSPTSQISVNYEKSKPDRRKKEKKPKKILTRGQILMNMVKLDTVELSLYETTPISYDEFIRSYGKLNTLQVSTQTNEDNLDVEIQTDISEYDNKWTQFPVKCRSNLDTIEDVRLFKMEHLGVGGDQLDSVPVTKLSYDLLNLNEFLSRAGKVVLALLEEKQLGGTVLQNETHEFPFSEGYIKLSVNSLSFLCGRPVTMLHYSEINNKILLSIHACSNEKIEHTKKQEYIMDCCMGCVWNVNQPSRPIKLFYAQSPIRACCFHCTNNNIIFAGLQDGSICLWDLREEETWHQKIVDKINEMDWVVRSPTYTTAGNWETELHMSPIVAIRILSKMGQDEAENFSDKFVSIQICSLDEEGRLIIWSVLRNFSSNTGDLGLTQWGKVKLVKSQEVPLLVKKNKLNNVKKEFVDLNVDNVDSNNLYIATNDTNILYTNCIGGRSNVPYYKINEMDSCGSTTCIEVCPFNQSFFFAGCNDGSIRLHSLNIEIPLLKLKDENSSAGIKNIQWSKSKPLTIYILDDHSRIVVWNLSISDIHPMHTVSTKSWGNVKCMKLSPCNTNRDKLNQYLALGTDTGNVEVHKLKKDFYYSQQDDFLQEMNTFLRYVSIL